MKHPSIILAALCCCLLVSGCGGRRSSSSDSGEEPASRTIKLQDYIIRLVPYYDDEASMDYVMKNDKLVILFSPTDRQVCGTVDRLDDHAFEVGVEGDYQDGGKIYPRNAAIFRGEKVIGRVTDNPYRFAVFDLGAGRIYENAADYENRDIADVEYLKFKLVKPGDEPAPTSQDTSPESIPQIRDGRGA